MAAWKVFYRLKHKEVFCLEVKEAAIHDENSTEKCTFNLPKQYV